MPSITRRATKVGRPAVAEADVLAATRRLLADGARFTEIGVQQICTEAGVARSTFYSNFRDKTDLIMRLTGDMMASAFDLATAWSPADGADGLVDSFLRVVAFYREHATVRRAFAEVATYDPTVRDFLRQHDDRYTEWSEASIRAEQAAGRTPADVDAAGAARLIIVGGERAISAHVETADPDTDAAFARELAMTWWWGVYRRPSEHRG